MDQIQASFLVFFIIIVLSALMIRAVSPNRQQHHLKRVKGQKWINYIRLNYGSFRCWLFGHSWKMERVETTGIDVSYCRKCHWGKIGPNEGWTKTE